MINTKGRIFAGAAGMAALAWTSFTAAVALGQNRLLFNPVPPAAGPKPRSAVHRTRPIVLHTPDGTRLSGWLLTPRPARVSSAVLYFGGRSEEVSWLVQDAATMFPDSAVLALNYRGYGASHGAPAESHLVADAEFLYDWLAERPWVDRDRIALVGRSLGSGVAVQIAARRPAAAVMLLTPYDSILALARRKFRTVPVDWVLRHRFESVKHAAALRAPVFVLRAASDRIVPHVHTDLLVKTLPTLAADVTIAGSDHSNLPHLPAAQAMIRTLLDDAFRMPRAGSGQAAATSPARTRDVAASDGEVSCAA